MNVLYIIHSFIPLLLTQGYVFLLLFLKGPISLGEI